MAKFFSAGTADIDSILDDEFGDEGLNFDIEQDGMTCCKLN